MGVGKGGTKKKLISKDLQKTTVSKLMYRIPGILKYHGEGKAQLKKEHQKYSVRSSNEKQG